MNVENSTSSENKKPLINIRELAVLLLLVVLPLLYIYNFYEGLPKELVDKFAEGRGVLSSKSYVLAEIAALQLYIVILYVYALFVSGQAITSGTDTQQRVARLNEEMYEMTHLFLAFVFYPILIMTGIAGPIELHQEVGWEGGNSAFVLLSAGTACGFVIIVSTIAFLVRHRRISARLDAIRGPAPSRDPREKEYWRWLGAFYNNSENPSLWVEKKLGAGWTLNMGHSRARRELWRMAAVILLPVLVIMVIVFMGLREG